MTRIVFMGTPAFSAPILDGLIDYGYEVVAVVTQPDRLVGRKKILTQPPVKVAALKHELEVLQPEKISGSPEMARVIELAPDLIVTAAFGQFLPEKILQVPTYGAINVHASLLPKYRGGAPVHYAIMNGESETGVTIMEMIKKMDAGDILRQEALPITLQDDVGTMFEKLSMLGCRLLLETLPELLAGKIVPIQQVESEVTFSPNISREQEGIDWSNTAEQIDCKVRGLRPWPSAFTTYQETNWKIWDVTIIPETTTEQPGTVIEITKKAFWIAAGAGSIVQINRLQPAGKSQLSASEFLNGVGKNLGIGDQVN